jgi:hypothetical protein
VDVQVVKAELERLRAAIERVRAVHRRYDDDPGGPAYCIGCNEYDMAWPCPTIRALDGEG